MSAWRRGPRPASPGASIAAPRLNPYLGLIVAMIAVSFSAIFISEATTPPLITAAYRMALTALLLAPSLYARRARLLALSWREFALLAAAGVLLAVHFATWTVSLFYTSVASSVLLVSIHPVIVAALAWVLLAEPPRRAVVMGIALSLAGSVVLAGGDMRLGGRALTGDGLALAGAIVFAFYLIIGRRLRQRLDLVTYSAPVYTLCALTLALIALFAHQPFAPLTARNAALFVALALVCTLGGHFVYNWTLRYVDTATVSVSFLGEPIISALLAWPILGQVIRPFTALGGAVVLVGIFLATRD